jgi:hypothetical protein
VKVTPLRKSPSQCACQYSLSLPQHLRQSQCADWPVVDRRWNDLPFNAANVILWVFGSPLSIRKKPAPVAGRKKTQSFVGLLCPSGGRGPVTIFRPASARAAYVVAPVLYVRIHLRSAEAHYPICLSRSPFPCDHEFKSMQLGCKCSYSSKGMQLAR